MEAFIYTSRLMDAVCGLKELKRTGWVKRGVHDPESVADHSLGVALMALTLAERAGVDPNKSMRMALIHDLPESIAGDPTPQDNIPPEVKFQQELAAMHTICDGSEGGAEMLTLWLEYEAKKTPEAIFVNACDKLEMMYQAYRYGKTQPNIPLDDFWTYAQRVNFGPLQELFNQLEVLNKAE